MTNSMVNSPVDSPVNAAVDSQAERLGVSLSGVSKSFGDVAAVANLDLEVAPGEFFSMLGPSGSGKTTVLRLIAGFETVSQGKIQIGSQDVTALAPFDRNVNTVFQDYALFPHMTIADNVAYGLKARKVPKSEMSDRVAEAIARVKLSQLADRLPHQLSGGQRQRIALARALVLEPKVLLLDEPLGALDKQLREEMQVELKQIQREVGITFIFVTHDQEEALALSDRIAVFNAGKIEQIGTPKQVYEYPETEFVAGFLGLANLIRPDQAKKIFGIDELVSIRPERVQLMSPDAKIAADETAVSGTITEAVYIGSNTRFILETIDGLRLIASSPNDHHPDSVGLFQRGDAAQAVWKSDHVSVVKK